MANQTSSVQFLHPEELHSNPAFSQVVVTKGFNKTIYVGGQNAVSAAGEIIGRGDIKAQATQVLHNLEKALEAAGASMKHIIKWNVYAVEGQPYQPAFEVFQNVMRQMDHPPLITVLYVSGLAHPDFLLEIEAIAVIPDGEN